MFRPKKVNQYKAAKIYKMEEDLADAGFAKSFLILPSDDETKLTYTDLFRTCQALPALPLTEKIPHAFFKEMEKLLHGLDSCIKNIDNALAVSSDRQLFVARKTALKSELTALIERINSAMDELTENVIPNNEEHDARRNNRAIHIIEMLDFLALLDVVKIELENQIDSEASPEVIEQEEQWDKHSTEVKQKILLKLLNEISAFDYGEDAVFPGVAIYHALMNKDFKQFLNEKIKDKRVAPPVPLAVIAFHLNQFADFLAQHRGLPDEARHNIDWQTENDERINRVQELCDQMKMDESIAEEYSIRETCAELGKEKSTEAISQLIKTTFSCRSSLFVSDEKHEANDRDEHALSLMIQSRGSHDPGAMYHIGNCYLTGSKGVEKNIDTAIKWYQKSLPKLGSTSLNDLKNKLTIELRASSGVKANKIERFISTVEKAIDVRELQSLRVNWQKMPLDALKAALDKPGKKHTELVGEILFQIPMLKTNGKYKYDIFELQKICLGILNDKVKLPNTDDGQLACALLADKRFKRISPSAIRANFSRIIQNANTQKTSSVSLEQKRKMEKR